MRQEVPRTTDRNPKTTTYLWYVSLPHAYRALEAEMWTALARMSSRLDAESATAAQLSAAAKPTNVSETSDEQRQEAAVAHSRARALEVAIARLANTALLLRNL